MHACISMTHTFWALKILLNKRSLASRVKEGYKTANSVNDLGLLDNAYSTIQLILAKTWTFTSNVQQEDRHYPKKYEKV